MSEYQYYEFQSLDQPLTSKAKAAAHSLSSRARVTANSASFLYNWSDFPGDPLKLMHEHFDAMLYITNWGTRQLMFRFPAHAIPAAVMMEYQYSLYGDGYGDQIAWLAHGDHVVLNLELSETEATGAWVDGEGLLTELTPLRADIMRGDYRALYLAWLKIAEGFNGDHDDYNDGEEVSETEFIAQDASNKDKIEPPVPPNLRTLSPALNSLIGFFELDPDLVTAAAQNSPTVERLSEDLTGLIDQLTDAEKRSYLELLLRGEANLDLDLARRLRTLSRATQQLAIPGSRSLQQMIDASKTIRMARIQAERQAAEAARIKRLEVMIPHESEIWARVPQLIEEKQAAAYEEAVRHLKDLHDIAVYQNRLSEFARQLGAIRAAYPKYSGLRRRIKEAGLL